MNETTTPTNTIRRDPPRTDVLRILPDMNAGVFEQQVNRALSDVAANVATYGKKGEVVLRLRMKQVARDLRRMARASLDCSP